MSYEFKYVGHLTDGRHIHCSSSGDWGVCDDKGKGEVSHFAENGFRKSCSMCGRFVDSRHPEPA
jgi:hypothetical protein